MKKTIKKIVAHSMVIVMFLMLPLGQVNAEYEQEEFDNQTMQSKSTEDDSGVENKQDQKSSLKIEYLYVESPILECGNEQNIIISMKADEIEDVLLSYEIDGIEKPWKCTKNVDNLYVFTRYFASDEIGEYTMSKLKLTINGKEEEIQLSELGFIPQFEVITTDLAAEALRNQENSEIVRVEEENIAEQIEDALEQSFITKTKAQNKEIVIVLDPGHDGISPGAQYKGLGEEKLALKIAKYCKEELEKYSGIKVYLTRENMSCPANITYNHSTREGECLQKRVDIAKEKGADMLISLHLNSFYSPEVNGAEVYYPNKNWRPDIGMDGKNMADKIQKELVKLGLKNRGIKEKTNNDKDDQYVDGSQEDYYAIIRQSKYAGFPGLIVEHAFITGNSDFNNFLLNENGLKSLGIADATGIASYFNLKKAQWIYDSNGWWYKYADGSYPVNKFEYIDRKWYYFDSTGYMSIGWKWIQGKCYYFYPDGHMASNEKIGSDYVDSSGVWIKNEWKKDYSGWWYRHGDGSYSTNKFEYIDGKWYYFNSIGYMITGWKWINGKCYYFYPDGHMASNEKVGSDYVDASGQWIKNEWKKDNTGWWYRHGDGGYSRNKFENIGGNRYYFGATGYMVTGWKWIGEKCYYFYPDGHMASNEKVGSDYVDVSGQWIKNEWKKDNTGWWYRHGDGSYSRNKFEYIDRKWYYFNSKGYRITGWKWVDGKCYYFHPDGHMASDEKIGSDYVDKSGAWIKDQWKKDSAGWWYQHGDGNYSRNKFEYISGKWYYFNQFGYMITGWKWIDGKCYYFHPDGHMASDEKIGSDYVDKSGAWITNQWKKDNTGWWYRYSDGTYPTKQFKEIANNVYYFDENGYMQIGWVMTGECWNYFNENGVLDRGKKKSLNKISGTSHITTQQMVRFYNENAPISYPGKKLHMGGAATIEEFCEIIIEEAEKEGIKPEIVFAQAMLETGWFRFGGDVKIEQFNFAGIGASGNHVAGADFSGYGKNGVRMGIRAQVQHLKAYSSNKKLINECVDPRFSYVERECAPYVEWLGQKENPLGKGWAVSKNYGINIQKIVQKMY